MKKFLIVFLLIVLSLPVFASNWVQIFEKQYLDFESIKVDYKNNTVSFWVKALRKNATDKFDGKDYWYMLDYYTYDCSQKKTSLDVMMVYDLKNNLIFSNEWSYHDWQTIAPDTYADGYYRMFCLVPFNENPLLKR